MQVAKEIKSGQYRLSSFFLAKTLVGIPFESVIAVIFTVIIYYMIGFQSQPIKWFIFAVTLVLVNLISEMVGFILGVITEVRTSVACSQHLQATVMVIGRFIQWHAPTSSVEVLNKRPCQSGVLLSGCRAADTAAALAMANVEAQQPSTDKSKADYLKGSARRS